MNSCVVFGGASGLGRATASLLARSGYRVLVADLGKPDWATGPGSAGPSGEVYHETNVTDEKHVNAALDVARGLSGNEVAVAVNCAGVGYARRTLSPKGEPHSLEDFTRILTVNAIGSFNALRLSSARMAKRHKDENCLRGVIINTASVAAYEGQIGQAAYSASKGAVVGMTLPCARDLARTCIRVCAIAPGLFETPLLEALPDKVQKELALSIPCPQRLGRPSEFASLVHEIIRNPMLNGEVIRLRPVQERNHFRCVSYLPSDGAGM